MTEFIRLKLSNLKERERKKGRKRGRESRGWREKERRKEGACIIPTLQRDQLYPYTHTHHVYK